MTWIIIFLALILRIPLLRQSLWLDESIEALALMGKMGPILEYALKDFQPPLYHFIALIWTHFAGYSELALRTPSLISGLVLVYFVIKLGNVVGGKKVGNVAGILAATNPLLIYYSQEGRTYMMTAAFVTGSFYYLYELLQMKNASKRNTMYYLLSTTCALWSSYIAWVVIGLEFLYLLYLKRWDLAKWTLLAGFTLIVWLPSFLSSLGFGLQATSVSPEWGKVVGGISVKALALTWVKAVIGRISFDSQALYAGVLVIMFFLHAHVLRFAKKVPPMLLIWLSATLVAAGISLVVPVYSYFRVLFVVPAYLLLLALGLSRLNKAWFYVVVASQLVFIGIYYFTPRFHKEDWRTFVRQVNIDVHSAVGMPSLAQDAPLRYYGLKNKVFEPKEIIYGYDRIYYLKYVEDIFDLDKKGPARLNKAGYMIRESRSYPGLQVDIYAL